MMDGQLRKSSGRWMKEVWMVGLEKKLRRNARLLPIGNYCVLQIIEAKLKRS
jgi:hypothetical protein